MRGDRYSKKTRQDMELSLARLDTLVTSPEFDAEGRRTTDHGQTTPRLHLVEGALFLRLGRAEVRSFR
jgi:hypothetical protein